MDRKLDSLIQAEYEDGFVLDELELDDVNPYGDGNVFTAVLNRQPEREHGRMVRFSCFWKGRRHDIDWSLLPRMADPVRWRHAAATFNTSTGEQTRRWTGVDFGFDTTIDGFRVEAVEKFR